MAILDTAVEGIITIDGRGVIESANAGAERIFGYSPDEMIDHNVRMLMPTPFAEEHDRYLESYPRTGHAKIIGFGREVSGLRKDGSIFPVELVVSKIVLDDRRLFTVFLRDLTARRHAERGAQELRSSLAHMARVNTLGVLSGSLAHELNQPLGIILSNAEAARDLLQREPLDMEEAQAILTDIIAARVCANAGTATRRRSPAASAFTPATPSSATSAASSAWNTRRSVTR